MELARQSVTHFLQALSLSWQGRGKLPAKQTSSQWNSVKKSAVLPLSALYTNMTRSTEHA